MSGGRKFFSKHYSDSDLLRMLRSGNQKDRAIVYRHMEKHPSFYPAIRRLILGQYGTEEDAKDIFHQVLEVLWTNVNHSGFELRANSSQNKAAALSTYMYSIAKRLWFKEFERMKKQRITNLETDDISGQEIIPMMELYERKKHVMELLATLGKNCQEILELSIVKEWSVESIANKLKITEQHVKNHKVTCKKRLKEKILNSPMYKSLFDEFINAR